jgi:hypothetical protein
MRITPLCRHSACSRPGWRTAVTTRTKKDHMRTPVSDRRPRAGMTLTPRNRQSRPLPMSAVAVRRGQFGEFELRPVREHTVEALTAHKAPTEG